MNTRNYFNSKIALTMLGILLSVAIFAGCGETRIAVHPVRGKVIFQGQSPEGAQVVLHPVGASQAAHHTATGSVKSDGTFQIGVYEDGDGAPPGEYIATVQWFRFVADEGSGGRGPNVLPEKYSRAETSPFRVTVKSGNNELPAFDVTD